MFFTLKKKLMCRAIEKKNRQHPFDYAAAENYTLAPDSDPLVNNSYYFSAHDEKMSLFARLGKRVHQDETWFALYNGERGKARWLGKFFYYYYPAHLALIGLLARVL